MDLNLLIEAIASDTLATLASLPVPGEGVAIGIIEESVQDVRIALQALSMAQNCSQQTNKE